MPDTGSPVFDSDLFQLDSGMPPLNTDAFIFDSGRPLFDGEGSGGKNKTLDVHLRALLISLRTLSLQLKTLPI